MHSTPVYAPFSRLSLGVFDSDLTGGSSVPSEGYLDGDISSTGTRGSQSSSPRKTIGGDGFLDAELGTPEEDAWRRTRPREGDHLDKNSKSRRTSLSFPSVHHGTPPQQITHHDESGVYVVPPRSPSSEGHTHGTPQRSSKVVLGQPTVSLGRPVYIPPSVLSATPPDLIRPNQLARRDATPVRTRESIRPRESIRSRESTKSNKSHSRSTAPPLMTQSVPRSRRSVRMPVPTLQKLTTPNSSIIRRVQSRLSQPNLKPRASDNSTDDNTKYDDSSPEGRRIDSYGKTKKSLNHGSSQSVNHNGSPSDEDSSDDHNTDDDFLFHRSLLSPSRVQRRRRNYHPITSWAASHNRPHHRDIYWDRNSLAYRAMEPEDSYQLCIRGDPSPLAHRQFNKHNDFYDQEISSSGYDNDHGQMEEMANAGYDDSSERYRVSIRNRVPIKNGILLEERPSELQLKHIRVGS